MFVFKKGIHTGPMSIWQFLDWETPTWAMSRKITSIEFRVVGQFGIYRTVYIGERRPRLLSEYMKTMPEKYKYIPDIGGLMGELMDLSVQFNLYKVSVGVGVFECQYTVWISKVEPEQEHNIDADMVEKFTKKVFGK